MIISIRLLDDCRYACEVDQQLQRALATLRVAVVRTSGGGRFRDGSAYIVLALEADGPAALAALERAGIDAFELRPGAKAGSAQAQWAFVRAIR